MVLPQRAIELRRGATAALEPLPLPAARALTDLLKHVRLLDERIGEYERELKQHARSDERAQRIQALSGVGPISVNGNRIFPRCGKSDFPTRFSGRFVV